MMMQYKGYIGTIEVDPEADLLHGTVLGIRDVVNFESRTPAELEKAFRDSVDDYLNFCKERDEEPEKPYSGKFVVRIDPAVHRLISAVAESTGLSLNAWINQRLAKDVAEELSLENHSTARVQVSASAAKASRTPPSQKVKRTPGFKIQKRDRVHTLAEKPPMR